MRSITSLAVLAGAGATCGTVDLDNVKLVTMDLYNTLVPLTSELSSCAATILGESGESDKESFATSLFDSWSGQYLIQEEVSSTASALAQSWTGQFSALRDIAGMGRTEAVWAHPDHFDDYLDVSLGIAASSAGVTLTDDLKTSLFACWGTLNARDGAALVMQQTQSSYAVGVLSNGKRELVVSSVEQWAEPDYIVTSSDANGAFFPDAQLYQALLNETGLEAHEILHIAGDAADALGAKVFGLNVVLNKVNNPPYMNWSGNNKYDPDCTISSLDDLGTVLSSSAVPDAQEPVPTPVNKKNQVVSDPVAVPDSTTCGDADTDNVKLITFDVYAALSDLGTSLNDNINAALPDVASDKVATLVSYWEGYYSKIKDMSGVAQNDVLFGPGTVSWEGDDRFQLFKNISLNHSLARAGLTVSDTEYEALLESWNTLQAWPGTLEALSQLRNMTDHDGNPRFKLAIMSNGDCEGLTKAADQWKVSPYYFEFDYVFCSSNVGMFKPEADFYAQASLISGYDKSEIMHVAGAGFDAVGSKAYGYWNAHNMILGGGTTNWVGPGYNADCNLSQLLDLPPLMKYQS